MGLLGRRDFDQLLSVAVAVLGLESGTTAVLGAIRGLGALSR